MHLNTHSVSPLLLKLKGEKKRQSDCVSMCKVCEKGEKK